MAETRDVSEGLKKLSQEREVSGKARVIKKDALIAFIRSIAEEVAGEGKAEVIARLTDAQMKLGRAQEQAAAFQQQIGTLKAQLSAEQAKAADELAAKLSAAERERNELAAKLAASEKARAEAESLAAAAQRDAENARRAKIEAEADASAARAERDAAAAEAAELAETLRLLDAFGEAAELAREVAKLRQQLTDLELATELADMHRNVDYTGLTGELQELLADPMLSSGVAALGGALLTRLTEAEVVVDQLRDTVAAGEGTLGVFTRLVEAQARGEVLGECVHAWSAADGGASAATAAATATSMGLDLPTLPSMDAVEGGGGDPGDSLPDLGEDILLET